jgi:hypothetical protein
MLYIGWTNILACAAGGAGPEGIPAEALSVLNQVVLSALLPV